MTPVLFLAWYFPPTGGAGVQRSLAFVRHLPEYGFQPLVIAGPDTGKSRWAPRDESLMAQLPEGLRVLRPAELPPPTVLQRLRQKVTGQHAGLAAHWLATALALGTPAGREHHARAIVVTLGPYECLDAALALGNVLNVPVVADLRDPWAFDEMNEYAHGLQRFCDRRRMHRALPRCRAIVMNTPEAAALARQHLPEVSDRVHCITNGYEEDDFLGPAPVVQGDRFRIVHTGYLHTDGALRQERRPAWRRLLGGQQQGVDLWGRTHRYLLEALERLGRQAPELLARIELHLHGVSSPDDAALTARSPVRHLVREHGYCSHAEAVAAMRAADLLFLPMQGLPPGRRASIVPGKTYEYLASCRPILAAVPQGDARDFVLAAGGCAVEPEDVPGLAMQLERLVSEGRRADRPAGPEVVRFERSALSEQLAEVLRRSL